MLGFSSGSLFSQKTQVDIACICARRWHPSFLVNKSILYGVRIPFQNSHALLTETGYATFLVTSSNLYIHCSSLWFSQRKISSSRFSVGCTTPSELLSAACSTPLDFSLELCCVLPVYECPESLVHFDFPEFYCLFFCIEPIILKKLLKDRLI